MKHELDEHFKLLRVTLESQLGTPARIVITSAALGDGTTYVAYGLARAFASAGLRTAIVDAKSQERGLTELLPPSKAPKSNVHDGEGIRSSALDRRLDLILFEDGSGQKIDNPGATVVQDLRSKYDVTIIDTDVVSSSSAALEMSQRADGVLIAVRLGRAMVREDHEIVPLLRRVGAPVAGVVTTARGARIDVNKLWVRPHTMHASSGALVPPNGARRAGAPEPFAARS